MMRIAVLMLLVSSMACWIASSPSVSSVACWTTHGRGTTVSAAVRSPPLLPGIAWESFRKASRSLEHASFVPPPISRLVGVRNRQVLSFVLSYLEETPGLGGVRLYSSGGFVRDLLLGLASDDLDLALELRHCEPDVTVDSIVAGMPAFAAASGFDAIESVEVVTLLSVASRTKAVDAATLSMVVYGETVLVDLMPTIAREVYDAQDRIPRREGHGTAWQDTLRRDLTANAMLLEIMRPEKASTGALSEQSPLDPLSDPPPPLAFRLHDYHGGLDDLRAGVLRAPYPRNVHDDLTRNVCQSLGLPAQSLSTLALSAADDGEDLHAPSLQTLWWAKALRDDPLRIVRTLRFAATLQFRVHGSFWRAVPLSLAALRVKVSGPRKVAELHKIAKAGQPALLDFFELAFSPLPAAPAAQAPEPDQPASSSQPASEGHVPPEATADWCLGDALFSGGPLDDGAEDDGTEQALSVTTGFDAQAMRAVAGALPEAADVDVMLGAVLSAAIVACDLRQHTPCTVGLDDEVDLYDECLLAGPPCSPTCDDEPLSDACMAACLEISSAEVERACNGLQASAQMTHAAVTPLAIASALLRPPAAQAVHGIFANAAVDGAAKADAACDGDGVADGVSAHEFAALLQTWELLRLDPSQTRRRLEVGSSYVLALLATRCAPSTIEQLQERVRLLSTPGPSIRGGALAGVEGRRRGELITHLHVLCRLRGEAPELHTTEQLSEYMERCDGLLAKLEATWRDED